MTPVRLISLVRVVASALVLSALLLLAAAADRAFAYTKPAGGAWTFQDSFEGTDGGALVLSRDASKVAKLVLRPGADSSDDCGTTAIRLASRPKVRSYRSVNGRYAVGAIRRGLFVPTPMSFKQGRRAFRAKLLLLWDDTGRFLDAGQLDWGDCRISFHARKGR